MASVASKAFEHMPNEKTENAKDIAADALLLRRLTIFHSMMVYFLRVVVVDVVDAGLSAICFSSSGVERLTLSPPFSFKREYENVAAC